MQIGWATLGRALKGLTMTLAKTDVFTHKTCKKEWKLSEKLSKSKIYVTISTNTNSVMFYFRKIKNNTITQKMVRSKDKSILSHGSDAFLLTRLPSPNYMTRQKKRNSPICHSDSRKECLIVCCFFAQKQILVLQITTIVVYKYRISIVMYKHNKV